MNVLMQATLGSKNSIIQVTNKKNFIYGNYSAIKCNGTQMTQMIMMLTDNLKTAIL
jgi:hypothetical protein